MNFGEKAHPAAARSAWEQVSMRHPALGEGSPSFEWNEVDWTAQEPSTIPRQWAELLAGDAAASFADAPWVRWTVVALPGGAHQFLWTFPAFLLDEPSIARLLIRWLVILSGDALPPVSEPAAWKIADAAVWKELLAGACGPLEPAFRSTQSARVSETLLLGRQESEAFKAFCAGKELDPATVLHAAFALVLRRLGAEGDVSFAVLPGEFDGVGFSENLLPVRHEFSGTVSTILQAAASARARTLANASIAPSAALNAAGHPAAWAETPGVVFAWRGPELNDVLHTVLPRWINFDARVLRPQPPGWTLEVREGVRLSLCLSAGEGSPAGAAGVLSRLAVLLADLPEIFSKPVETVPVLSPVEVRELRAASRGPVGPDEKPKTVLDVFRATVAAHPKAPAVRDGEYVLTFEEIDTLSDRLAGHLSHVGLAGGWHVGLFLSPSSWIPVAILGSLKAGNSIIPIDPSASPEWAEATMSAHDVGVVLCDAASAPLLEGSSRRKVVLDQEWEAMETAALPALDVSPDSAAAVITGFPGGATPPIKALTHGMLAAAMTTAARVLDFNSGGVLLAHAAAGSGAFLEEWLLPLASGGTASVCDDPTALVSRHGITHVRLTTPEWANQIAAVSRGDFGVAPTLAVVAVEAGTPTGVMLHKWQAASRARAIVFFSPSSLVGLGLAGAPEADTLFLPVGTPVDDVDASVCDADGHDLPACHAGRLLLRFSGWKSVAGESSKRGFETGIRAWRDPAGRITIEAGPQCPYPGHVVDRKRFAAAVSAGAVDAMPGEVLWTLAGTHSPFNVTDWPLGPGGWVDPDLLPRPEAPKPSAPKAIAVAAPASGDELSDRGASSLAVSASWSPLVVLNEAGPRQRLALVHPAGGHAGVYENLAAALGGSRRVVALRSRGTTNPELCHSSVESAAAAYIAAVLEDDPLNPFLLGGFGFGAIVALEMARQIKAAGRPVPRLLLVGANAPEAESSGWGSLMRKAIKRFSQGGPIEPPRFRGGAFTAHEALLRRYRFLNQDLEAEVIVPSDFTPEMIAAWQDLMPDAGVETTKCTWEEMLDFPGVKRLASIIDAFP